MQRIISVLFISRSVHTKIYNSKITKILMHLNFTILESEQQNQTTKEYTVMLNNLQNNTMNHH